MLFIDKMQNGLGAFIFHFSNVERGYFIKVLVLLRKKIEIVFYFTI